MDPTVNLPRLAASFLRASSSPCHQARHRALHRSPCLRCCASRRRWRRRDRWQLPKRRGMCGAGDRFRQSGCGTKSARFSIISAANIATLRVHLRYLLTSSTAQGGGGSFKNRKPIGEVGCCESGMAERSH